MWLSDSYMEQYDRASKHGALKWRISGRADTFLVVVPGDPYKVGMMPTMSFMT